MHSYVISSMKPFKKLKHLLCTTTCLLDFLQKENYCIFHLCSVKLQKIKKSNKYYYIINISNIEFYGAFCNFSKFSNIVFQFCVQQIKYSDFTNSNSKALFCLQVKNAYLFYFYSTKCRSINSFLLLCINCNVCIKFALLLGKKSNIFK